MQVEIDAKGVAKTTAELHELGQRGDNIAPAADHVTRIFERAETERFNTRGRGSWPALKQSTVQWKRREGMDSRILRATGKLFESLAKSPDVDTGKHDISFKTDVPYARFHDTGKGVPRRRLIDLTAAEQQAIAEAIQEYVATGDRR